MHGDGPVVLFAVFFVYLFFLGVRDEATEPARCARISVKKPLVILFSFSLFLPFHGEVNGTVPPLRYFFNLE